MTQLQTYKNPWVAPKARMPSTFSYVGGFRVSRRKMDFSTREGRAPYRARRYANRMRAMIRLLGGACVKCGEIENLQFDHIDPRTKRFTITQRWDANASVLMPELAKCQLLCEPCHIEKTAEEKSVVHGGGISGKRNCKCDPCRVRKNEYMQTWKANRRRQLIAA